MKPASCRGIVRSDVLVCFLGLFFHRILPLFRVCWSSSVFNPPMPVRLDFSLEGDRTIVVFSFRMCRFRVFGFGFSVYHCQFRSLFLAKAAELSSYCLSRRAGLLFFFYCYRFHSLFISDSNQHVVVFCLREMCFGYPSVLRVMTLPLLAPLASLAKPAVPSWY